MARKRRIPNPDIGRRIKDLMESNPNLQSQAALARKSGVDQTTIGRVIRGEVDTSAEILKRLYSSLIAVSRLRFCRRDIYQWWPAQTSTLEWGTAGLQKMRGLFAQLKTLIFWRD